MYNVMTTPFFNITGAMLNRFLMDMSSIDEYLPKVLEAAISVSKNLKKWKI